MKQQRPPQPALELIPVAHIVLDAQGFLASANARAQELLRIGAEHVGQSIAALGVGTGEIELLVERAHATDAVLMRTAVRHQARDGSSQPIDVIAVPMRSQAGSRGTVLIVLDRLRALADTELETANQELKAANEALEHLNAQLQSANESLRERISELQRSGAK